jgi:NAD(P)-dependent dehydrogenase (short-subunit alcohol dehydrogenase family)
MRTRVVERNGVYSVSGLSAIVVGGASGIGAAAARILARRGARVVVSDKNAEEAEGVAHELAEAGAEACAIAVDVADHADIVRLVGSAVEAFGGIDILINAAGIVRPAPLEELHDEDWQAVYDVNVLGALDLARAALPHLRESRHAAIVHVSSVGALFGRPNGGAYGSSKAALNNLTSQMALEWGPSGVRVNAVNPGTIDTPLFRKSIPPETVRKREAVIPLGRIGGPEEVAEVMVFLASPEASYLTGQAISVCGGHSISLMNAPMGA